MKKEVWGVNVIGNQGVNAINDFSIRPSDDGKDVIVSVNGAELTGEEFAELKDIAETGGGGTPDPGDAVNADVLSVKVTPAVMRFVPAIQVGDHLSDIYGYVPAIPDFDALTYDSTIEGQMPAAKIFGFDLIVTDDEQTTITVSGDLLAFQMSYDGMTVCGIAPIQSGGRFGETFIYLSGLKEEMGFDGWYPEAISGNFCSLADVMGLHGVDSYEIIITSLGATSQDLWGQYIGGSKTVEEISPEVKEVIWEKPYPTIKKVGQALVSVGEEYNLYPDLRVDEEGQFYFNINDVATVEYVVNLFGDNFGNGFTIRVLDSNDQPTLMIGFVRVPSSTTGLDHDVNAILVMSLNDQIYDIVYSTEEFDWENPMTHEQQHILHGWNEGLNHCEWDNGYYIAMSDGDTLTPEEAKQYVSYYGTVITVQEDLFYGNIKNSSAQWQDISVEVKPDDYSTTSTSNTSYMMVADGSGDMRRLNYSNMKTDIENDVKPTSGNFIIYSYDWNTSGSNIYATVDINNLTDNDTLMVVPYSKQNADYAQEANVYFAESSGNQVTFYCSTQPNNNIQFKYTLIKG